MKEFLKYTLATITGIIIASFLFFIIMLASFSAMIAAGDKPAIIEDNSVLVLEAGMMIPGRGNGNPLSGFDFINMEITPTPGLNEILKNLEKAAADEKIKGVLIENGLMGAGWATAGEVRSAIEKFRESGKFVISWTDYILTQECYYLSTAADKIYINPGSMVDFKGLSSEILFFRDALDKLGVEVQVTRHGKFKGAVEPFILDKLSEENKAQIRAYAGSIWDHVTGEISGSRNIPVTRLNEIADNLDGTIDLKAVETGLVDGIMFRDELIDTLKSLSGIEKDADLKLVSMTRYTKVQDGRKATFGKPKISVIYAEGTIVMGKGNEGNIGGNRYADIIRKERKDTTVKAIVLRVNSPGGNAIASDMIWRELQLAARVKPVVVSMGNFAASGGYYISAPATRIYAGAATISGSIGVFGLVPNAGKLLEQKLGLKSEVVNTNRNSDFPSLTRSMNSQEKELMQLSIEKIYSEFVSKVAEGRKLENSHIDSIGQGRVWSGRNALEIGLVDEIGGLNEAIKGASELAGIDEYSVRELPYLEDPYMKLLTQLSGDVKMKALKKELGPAVKYFNIVKEVSEMSGIQARIPYFVEIR